MKYFEAYCKEVGYDRNTPAPESIIKFYGYKKGEVREFHSRQDALKFSTIIDFSTANEKEINAFRASQAKLEAKAIMAWRDDLRDEHRDLTDKQFDLCYAKAYEDGHSAGYDEIAREMDEVTDFARNLLGK